MVKGSAVEAAQDVKQGNRRIEQKRPTNITDFVPIYHMNTKLK